jgi:hypothetical protein
MKRKMYNGESEGEKWKNWNLKVDWTMRKR